MARFTYNGPGKLDVTVLRGLPWAPLFRWRSGGTAETATEVDITDATIVCVVLSDANLTATTLAEAEVTIADAESGEFTVRLTAAQTATIPSPRAYWRVTITLLDQDERLLLCGDMELVYQ